MVSVGDVHSARGRKSIRDGIFFSKSHITLQKWMILMYWWSRQYAVTEAARVAEVDEGSTIDVYHWLQGRRKQIKGGEAMGVAMGGE